MEKRQSQRWEMGFSWFVSTNKLKLWPCYSCDLLKIFSASPPSLTPPANRGQETLDANLWQFSLQAQTEKELFRLIMYLDLSVPLFSLLQSINMFFHPPRFIGMGDAQFVSLLCHKAGETEEKHRIRRNAKKFPAVSFSATTGSFDWWMDGMNVWALHSRADVTAAPSILNAVAIDSLKRKELGCFDLATVQHNLSCRKTNAECVRGSGEDVHTHTYLLPIHPRIEIHLPAYLLQTQRRREPAGAGLQLGRPCLCFFSGVLSSAPSPGVSEGENLQVHL